MVPLCLLCAGIEKPERKQGAATLQLGMERAKEQNGNTGTAGLEIQAVADGAFIPAEGQAVEAFALADYETAIREARSRWAGC